MKGSVVIFCFSILLSGCSTSHEVPISDQSYFPLRVGNFQIYQVSQTAILRTSCDDNGQTVKNYQIKEWVTDSAKNAEGGYTYTIHRYGRPDDTQPWVNIVTWTARTNSSGVIANEDNTSYVKFIFPLVEKTTWNINSYNNLGADYDTLRNLRQPFTLTSGQKFQNTFSARYDNGEYIISHEKHVDVYASSIGLIYKEIVDLHYFDNTSDPCFGQQVPKSGMIYLQSLISYGHQ